MVAVTKPVSGVQIVSSMASLVGILKHCRPTSFILMAIFATGLCRTNSNRFPSLFRLRDNDDAESFVRLSKDAARTNGRHLPLEVGLDFVERDILTTLQFNQILFAVHNLEYTILLHDANVISMKPNFAI